jgi:hypothetical protein
MSRAALNGFPLGAAEKDFMLGLIRRFSKRLKGLFMSKRKKIPKRVAGLDGIYSL